MGSFIGWLQFKRNFDMVVTKIYDCICTFMTFCTQRIEVILIIFCRIYHYIFLFPDNESSNKVGNKYLIYLVVQQWCIQLSCLIAHILDTNGEYTKYNFFFNKGHEHALHISCFTFCKRKAYSLSADGYPSHLLLRSSNLSVKR